jgi:hypothetical protein
MTTKLSPTLKSLIKAPHARGNASPSPAPQALRNVFKGISAGAEKNGAKSEAWLTLSTAALVTANSPESVCGLFDYASEKGLGGKESAMVSRGMYINQYHKFLLVYSGPL